MNDTNMYITVNAGEELRWFWGGKVVTTKAAETFSAKMVGYTGSAAIIEYAASPNGKAFVKVN